MQDQYTREFAPVAVQAKGRQNFACNVSPMFTADQVDCKGCKLARTPDCSYYAQKIAALNAQEAILNYSFWLAQANYPGDFRRPELLICDEAHLVEEEIRKFATIRLSKRTLRDYRASPRHPQQWDIPDWIAWAEQTAGTIPYDSSDQQGKRLDDALHSLASDADPDNWVFSEDNYAYTFKPVWITPLADRLFLSHAEKIIFLSATILDPDVLTHNLGIDAASVDFIRTPSYFDVARRPLYYYPVGPIKSADEVALGRLTRRIDDLLDNYPGKNGLIHTSSYKVAQFIMGNSRHAARLLTHTTNSRASVIQEFKETRGAVLVSPSVTTGVDLPYDECSFQVIAKIAFPDLGDPQVKRRMKLGPDGLPTKRGRQWYAWQTACNIIQAYGRGMRAADDQCDTYILDGNFGWFMQRSRELLPAWFKQAIRYEQTPDAPTLSIAEQLAKIRAKLAAKPIDTL